MLRDTLSSFVDAAMMNAYGPQWDEIVADKDAKRRPDGRRQIVSKNDLAVMLKVIQHELIAPWWNSTTYPDPRIRSFASEILTLRNLFSHGNDCPKEHVRLIDTASRLLRILDLSVPGGLQPPDQTPTNDLGDGVAVAIPEQLPVAMDHFDKKVASLEAPGERVAQMLRTVDELRNRPIGQELENYTADPGFPASDLIQRALDETIDATVHKTPGAEVLDLLEETHRLEVDSDTRDSTVLKVLALYVRCLLLDGLTGVLARTCLACQPVERQ